VEKGFVNQNGITGIDTDTNRRAKDGKQERQCVQIYNGLVVILV